MSKSTILEQYRKHFLEVGKHNMETVMLVEDVEDAMDAFVTQETAALKKEIEVDDYIIKDLERLLAAIPECPVHGACIPYALEWVEKIRTENANLKSKLSRPDQDGAGDGKEAGRFAEWIKENRFIGRNYNTIGYMWVHETGGSSITTAGLYATFKQSTKKEG